MIDVPLKASNFEFMCLRVSSRLKSVIGLVVYRTEYASCDFFAEFEEIMNIMSSYNEEVLVLRDFNFHLECFADKNAENFKNIFHMHDFKSCGVEPTHEQGGWLDVVATKTGFKVDCFDVSFSDHDVLMRKSQLKVPALLYKTFKVRRWKDLDVERFISKLLNTPLVFSTDLNLDSAKSKYFSTLKCILDELIPEKVVRIHQRLSDVWFDEECKISKCITRKLERKYLKSHSTTDYETWFRQKNLYKCLCGKKRKEFWDLKLFVCKNKSVKTWKYINEVAGRGKAGEGKGIEIGSFKKYLVDKIGEIKSVDGDLFQIEVSSRTSVLDEFFEVDEEELVKRINNLPNKQCALDSIPTWLLKRIASLIAPFLVSIFNSSFKSETVSQGLKLACVTPILKKTNLSHPPIDQFQMSLSHQKY